MYTQYYPPIKMDDILSYTDSIEGDLQRFDLPSLMQMANREGHDVNSCRTLDGINQCLSSVISRYPAANTLHEVAEQAIGTDDRDTIRRLTAIRTYLPIRWDAFLNDASGPILMTMLNNGVLTSRGRVEAAYRLRDPQLIDQYTRALNLSETEKIQYSIRYGYTPGIPDKDLRGQIESLLLDRITPLLSLSNYVLALGYSLEHGRTDVIDTIINQYSERSTSRIYDRNIDLDINPSIQLLSLTPQYNAIINGNYVGIPRNTMEYLHTFGYIQLPDIVRAIVTDDTSLLDTDDDSVSYIPSGRDLSLIIQYDAINIWRRYSTEISLPQILSLLSDTRDQIRRYILLSLSNGVDGRDDVVVDILLTKATANDMDDMLDLHNDDNEFEPLRVRTLSIAASKGYIEILDKYLNENNLYRVLSASGIYPQLGRDGLHDIVNLLNFKYEGTQLQGIGTFMLAIWTDIMDVSVPSHIWERYLAAALVNGNIPLVQTILQSFNISDHIRERAQLLIRQSHSTNMMLYRGLMRLFQ